ncbi:MAG: hypothetical protein RL625_1704, partial [Gemmatimonadota bacterium]
MFNNLIESGPKQKKGLGGGLALIERQHTSRRARSLRISARSIRLFSAATVALVLTACSTTEEALTGVEAPQAIAELNE